MLCLLGPVQWETAAGRVDLGAVKQRTVLAALAVEAGRLVTWTELVDRVWDQASATGSRGALYTYANRIRRLLEAVEAAADDGGPARLACRSGGYLLHLDPDQVDLHRFHRLTAAAEDAGRPDGERARLLSEALSLWQGRPLADLPGQWAAGSRETWGRQRLKVVVAWAEARVRLGEPDGVIGPVEELTVEYPLAEPLTGVLIRALAVAGRDAEALHCYAAYRTRLIEELGAEPGPQLRRLHEAVLRGTVSHSRRAPETLATEADRPVPPRQLPAGVRHFVGRLREQQTLSGLLDEAAAGNSAVVISVISGTAGVGKTALAIHWAHLVRDRFPDGQLHVDLRGFDPGGAVMGPAEAIRRLLNGLDVPAERIPADLDAQAGLYRSRLAGKRVLVVLDNARDAEQVRPLLPGAAGTVVLVTSRNQLSGLVAGIGAQPLTLDLLTSHESWQLLASRLGVDRLAAEPDAVEQIISRCARLPLALAIMAGRAAAHPEFPLAALADQLRNSARRLDVLADVDPATDVRGLFSWSYQALSPGAARLFRLLGLHPGPDISSAAAASLAGLLPLAVQPLLAELDRAHLIEELSPGRYSLHDLLRAYAAELTKAHDAENDRRAAVHRLLDHYLHTAYAADRLLNPGRSPITIPPPGPGVTPESPLGYGDALAWFATERAVLLAAVDAAGGGFDSHAWMLSWTVAEFLARRGHWHDLEAVGNAALAAARRLVDPMAEARAHRFLGHAYRSLGRLDEAKDQLRQALDVFAQLDHQVGQAHSHIGLAEASSVQGRHREAITHARQALELFRAAGQRDGEANALNALGWYHALLGDHELALTACQEALTLLQELGDRHGEAATWDSLGYAHHNLGHLPEAVACYRRALDMTGELGDRTDEAATLGRLAETYCAAGDTRSARQTWHQALRILEGLGHPDADSIRAELGRLELSTPGSWPNGSTRVPRRQMP